MDGIIFFALIALFVVIITFRNGVFDRLNRLERELSRLRDQLAAAQKREQESRAGAQQSAVTGIAVEPLADKKVPGSAGGNEQKPLSQHEPPPQPRQPGNISQGESVPPKMPGVPGAGIPGTSVPESVTPGSTVPGTGAPGTAGSGSTHQGAATPGSPQPLRRVTPPAPVARPSFFERNPDLEKFIGENLISKIGIAVLVLGIAFFVKYAIDNDWIGPVGRVAIGLLCGGLLVGVAHYLRNTYKAFSSVLIGGGLAVFYFTISLAFNDYRLFSQPVAFVIMVVITAFAVGISLLYDRQELAVIALIGGFLTPFIVSAGSGNYIALFTYLIILNAGLLTISLTKAWRLLNLLAFVFTSILFGLWLFSSTSQTRPGFYRHGFLFATIFYLMFFVINIAHNIKEKKKFIASDFGILLANTCLYFGAGLYCIGMMGEPEYRGAFCLTLGVFNLTASYFLFRKSSVDTNILYLLIGITLTFISLTAPIQLHGNHITLFWASETVLLYWLFQKSKISIIRVASLIIWVAMLLSLVIDISDTYGTGYTNNLPIVFNKGFLTVLCAAAGTYFLFLLRRKDPEGPATARISVVPRAGIFRTVGVVLLYIAGYFEIGHQFQRAFPGLPIDAVYQLFFTLLFILLVYFIAQRSPAHKIAPAVALGLLLLAMVIYLFQISFSFDAQRALLSESLHGHFAPHWLMAIIVPYLLYQTIVLYRRTEPGTRLAATWALCIFILIFLTTETHLIVNAMFFSGKGSLSPIQDVYIKAGWPIVWGLSSFGFMWMGMKYKFRPLRVISLTLFTITLLKLFVYDIVDIPAGGKIAAFFSLGVLLLIVSFMYQRLKKIIIDEEAAAK